MNKTNKYIKVTVNTTVWENKKKQRKSLSNYKTVMFKVNIQLIRLE